ncbi:MAG TPA: aminotransferase class I/II-fold pyridoxal phosphate-dependent enzyme [Candidatus Hydrogenedens sp.]|nr:aminotransferase class I/II-fold pyridoxal phosphate-dependent enzyme [Candidatus Hydrogenedens sp.]
MSYIAERMNYIDASGIRKVFALAAKMKNPINLSIGQPDYDVDEVCKDVAISAIKNGFNSYTQTWGIDELREAVQEYYQDKFGVKISNVMITCGVLGGLFLALLATVNPGDEVVFADPYFVMYKHLVNLLGGKPVSVDTYPDFHLTAEKIEPVITDKTKILILNSPSNPTGLTIPKEDLAKIADLAKKYKLLVITDEIYESLLYDEEPSTIAGMYDQVILLNGFSKNAGMTGWRVGYVAGPEDIIQQMNTLQQYTFVCAPSFAQKAAVKALKADMTEKIEAYRRKRNLIYEGLKDTFEVIKPKGAFYIFPKAPGGGGDEFVKKAIENNILIIPGSVFSDKKTHFRISFAAPDETIKRGVEELNKLAKQFL